jgi:hypothetical protein
MKEEEPQEVVALVNRIKELEATNELLTQRCIELEHHLSPKHNKALSFTYTLHKTNIQTP